VPKHKHKKKKNKVLLYAAAAVVAVALVVFILEITNTTHFFHKAATVVPTPKAITNLPAQSPGSKTTTTGNSVPQGSATDENGKVPTSGVSSNPSDWSTSPSGVIVLKSPESGSTFASGDTITGTSSVDPVQYRLIDNQVGVIDQGQLNVVNGVFTATIDFQSTAPNGQLDIYSTDSSGKELNEIQIPVNF
jgi:hypothetical protein